MLTTADQKSHIDLLGRLTLPDRYESLVSLLGNEVARLLMPPVQENIDGLGRVVEEARSSRKGVFVPVLGRSGIGKTTLISSLAQWFPKEIAETLTYQGAIHNDEMIEAVQNCLKRRDANDKRILALLVDHREGDPPTTAELAQIKRFIRECPDDCINIVFWPDTIEANSRAMSTNFEQIAGTQAIPLPFNVCGPQREAWSDIARQTLELSNNMSDITRLGVDPNDYDPSNFYTIGEYIGHVRREFLLLREKLKNELEKPVEIIIAFACENTTPGVISDFTNHSEYGLLGANALLHIHQGAVGRWWAGRRSLLTRAIIQLNVRCIALSPSTSMSLLRNCGDQDNKLFAEAGLRRYGPARAHFDLSRSDLGRFLLQQPATRHEGRGTPPKNALTAFQCLAKEGFYLGKDKKHNHTLARGIDGFLKENAAEFLAVHSESSLPFASIQPDIWIDRPNGIQAVEVTWRKGRFLDSYN